MKNELLFYLLLVIGLTRCQNAQEDLNSIESHFLSIDSSSEIQQLQTDLLNTESASRTRNFESVVDLANWERIKKEMRRNDEQSVYAMPVYIESDFPLNNLLIYREYDEINAYIVSLDLDLGTMMVENLQTGLVEMGTLITNSSSNGRAMWMDCYSITIGHTAYVEVGGLVFPKYAEMDYEICGSGEAQYPSSDSYQGSGGGDSEDSNSGNPVVDDSDLPCPIGFERVNGNCVKKCDAGYVRDDEGNCVEEEDDCNTSKDDLKKVFDKTSDAKLVEIANALNKYAADFGIDSKEKMQHFLSQAGHESTNYAGKPFEAFEENLNYRWEKLGSKDWKKYFNPASDPDADPNKADPNEYKRSETSDYVDKEKFANYVYDDANRSSRSKMGNTNPGDGYKYRGRGIFQLTGKYNYQQFNNFYKEKYDNAKDIVLNPDLVATDMDIAVISALWFFENNILDKITVDGNTSVEKVTEYVNGGSNGLAHRKEIHSKAKSNIDCD